MITYEMVKVVAAGLEPAKLVWRRYKRPAIGVYALLLDANPELVESMMTDPFIPVGMTVMIPIDSAILSGALPTVEQIPLLGNRG